MIELEKILEELKDKDLTPERKKEILNIIEILEERKKWYSIMETKLQPHQAQLLPDISKEIIVDKKRVPKFKFILYQGWNGSWKTFTWIYSTVLLALWRDTAKYWLPYIWRRRNIWIVTKSSSNVSWVLEPYLLWNNSSTRIPPEEVEKINKDNWVLKFIILKNWTRIEIKTYDQGSERLQGWNPDFLLVDEEPTNKDVWEELMVRAREFKSQILITMTPLSWLTPVYEFFYEQKTEEKDVDRRKVYIVSSLENEYADHSWLSYLSEQDKKMRIYGAFVPPSGLVYSSFNRRYNVVEHFNPEDLWYWTRYYAWLDFWVTHPTWFILIAVDLDNNIYAFDWFLESNLLLDDMADKIKALIKKYWISLEYIVADSAAKRERTELAKLWIKTQPADKWSKWENNESNRKASISKLNTLFSKGNLHISNKLQNSLVKELETHHYKNNSRDWDVVKEWDDMLDALRYVIWTIKENKLITAEQKRFEKKYKEKYNKQHYYKSKFKQPY